MITNLNEITNCIKNEKAKFKQFLIETLPTNTWLEISDFLRILKLYREQKDTIFHMIYYCIEEINRVNLELLTVRRKNAILLIPFKYAGPCVHNKRAVITFWVLDSSIIIKDLFHTKQTFNNLSDLRRSFIIAKNILDVCSSVTVLRI